MIFNLIIQHFQSDEPMAEWRVPHWDIALGDTLFVNGKNYRIIQGIPGENKITAIVDNCSDQGIL